MYLVIYVLSLLNLYLHILWILDFKYIIYILSKTLTNPTHLIYPRAPAEISVSGGKSKKNLPCPCTENKCSSRGEKGPHKKKNVHPHGEKDPHKEKKALMRRKSPLHGETFLSIFQGWGGGVGAIVFSCLIHCGRLCIHSIMCFD